ncbi:PAAR domain-containing protein [Haladaptatus sp. DFWS20]|uniref:PAAR domain-containing protein n=1 Tax=Haladaptatus sp. DFWS20 TaxID=3403467 RepID=UPI003EB69D39
MPPAARILDQTAHATPLTGAGSSNVFIGGKPAWRATDLHTCPLSTPTPTPIPHVGGAVQMGSSTVMINNVPATRMGDSIVENGPPNSIASGEPTVLIG